jgi:hypothetical protein
MGSETPLRCSQKPDNCFYPEADDPRLFFPRLPLRLVLKLSFHLCLELPSGLPFSVYHENEVRTSHHSYAR